MFYSSKHHTVKIGLLHYKLESCIGNVTFGKVCKYNQDEDVSESTLSNGPRE